MPFRAKLKLLGRRVAIRRGAGSDDATNRLDAKTNVARAKTTCLFVQSPLWSNGSIQSLISGRFLAWEEGELVLENSNETGRDFPKRNFPH